MARRTTLSVGELTVEKIKTESGNVLPLGATITVGDEAENVINVAIQLTDGEGLDLTNSAAVDFYLSSASDGLTLEANGADSWAIGTDGVLIANGGDSVIAGKLISESDGDIDIDITHAGADTFYLVVVLADGSIEVSDAITFDATT